MTNLDMLSALRKASDATVAQGVADAVDRLVNQNGLRPLAGIAKAAAVATVGLQPLRRAATLRLAAGLARNKTASDALRLVADAVEAVANDAEDQ